jgi:hypothetical protein
MGCCSSAPTCDQWNGEEGFVVCKGDCGQSGSVWGNGPYTADSNVCAAAKHAGVIDEKGGTFKVSYSDGRDSYESGTANGVTTSSYGSYPKTMEISKMF